MANENANNRAGRKPQEKEQQIQREGSNYLFVIGIDEYKEFPKLYNAVKDAKDVVHSLVQEYQFEQGKVYALYNEEATEENIFEKLIQLSKIIEQEDNLLIYFSGHGEYDTNLEEGSWIPFNGKAGASWTYIDFSRVLKYIKAIKSKHTFVIADSCYSGTLFTDRSKRSNITPRDFYIPSRYLLTAGRNTVVSDGKPGDNSPFADNLLWFLKNTKELQFSAATLCEKVKTGVSNNVAQIPRYGSIHGIGDRGGMFYFRKKDFIPSEQPSVIVDGEGEKRGQRIEQEPIQEVPESPEVIQIKNLSDLKKSLLAGIAERDFDGIFELIERYVQEDSKIFSDFLQQQGRYNGLLKRQRKGLVGDDFAERQYNLISAALEDYIGKLKDKDVKLNFTPEVDAGLDANDPFWKVLENSEKESLRRQAKTYQEKLNFLEEEESMMTDPEQKFTLKKRIEDTVARLEAIKSKLKD